MLGNRLVVGLDFGTTHTGVAFSESSDNSLLDKHIEVVIDWPRAGHKLTTHEKVPSEIAYTSSGVKWGACIRDGEQRYMWTKLSLDRTNYHTHTGETARILSEMTLYGPRDRRQPVTIVADFLREVKEHLVTNLDDRYGEQLWRTLPITLVITVPAVWSDAAKSRTLEAVSKAGFNTTELPRLKRTVTVTEPEAAALHTMKSFQGSIQADRFAVGDGFIVCDMGGGTVDIICYRVAELEPTALEEATIGAGDQCGSSFIDRAFIGLLESRLRPEDFLKFAESSSRYIFRTSMPPHLTEMVRRFSVDAKCNFSGKDYSFIDFPKALVGTIDDDEERGIQNGAFVITSDEMSALFYTAALDRTRELLADQIQQCRRNSVEPKCLILVGGFAASSFVLSEIRAFARQYGIEVIRPAAPTSAVVRGAVARGIEGDGRPRIRNRKCRRFYGTSWSLPFISGKHKVIDRYICEFTGATLAGHQMEWLLQKGEDMSTTTGCHGKVHMSSHFWPSQKRVMTIELLATDADKAPYRSLHENVYKVARLEANLETVPQALFKKRNSPSGELFYNISFDVEISVRSSLEFSLSINGKKYGSVTAKYT